MPLGRAGTDIQGADFLKAQALASFMRVGERTYKVQFFLKAQALASLVRARERLTSMFLHRKAQTLASLIRARERSARRLAPPGPIPLERVGKQRMAFEGDAALKNLCLPRLMRGNGAWPMRAMRPGLLLGTTPLRMRRLTEWAPPAA